jgi:hypothetical protein
MNNDTVLALLKVILRTNHDTNRILAVIAGNG